MIDLINSFDKYKRDINEYLNQIEQVLVEETFRQRIEASRQRLDHEKMHLLIVGEFSRGKSTFINALLGQPVLPSKVNPTTAIITTISGGNEKKLRINYKDNSYEEVDIPDDKINKFLEEYVTTINERANEIKETNITWEGALNDWGCIIVDTPGVNDLDEMREEITYSYLSNADACILIIDSQQPLSESERSFLRDKVMQKDINRILFVINRIDEVEEEPDGETTIRLINYVKGLLNQTLPSISNPEVHAVSSKEALRGRYKNTENVWTGVFDKFQNKLVDFISKNATKEKIPAHLNRLIGIINDGIKTYEEQISLVQTSSADLAEKMEGLIIQEKNLEGQLSLFNIFVENEIVLLANEVENESKDGFNSIKEILKYEVGKCKSNDDFMKIKSVLTQNIRQVVQRISDKVNRARFEIIEKINLNFKDILEEEMFGIQTSSSNALELADNNLKEVDLDLSSGKDKYLAKEEQKEKLLIHGSAIGLGALMFGPVGAIVGIFGGSFINKKLNGIRQSEEYKATVESVVIQINIIVKNAKESADELSKKELEPLKLAYSERAKDKIDALKLTIKTQQELLSCKGDELKIKIKSIENKIDYLKNIQSTVEKEVTDFYERA